MRSSEGDCLICEKHTTCINWHHTVPRSLGGQDSLQIPLCGNCHTVLHAIANETCAFVRTGKAKHKFSFSTQKQEQNAIHFLNILVEAQLRGVQDDSKEYVVQVKVPANIYNALHILKKDIGYTNIKTAVMFCLTTVLESKGLLNNERKKNNQAEASSASLWGVCWSGKRATKRR